MLIAMKACIRCGEEKPLDAFRVHTGYADGRRTICKECEAMQRANAVPEGVTRYIKFLHDNGYFNEQAEEDYRQDVLAALRKEGVMRYADLSADASYELTFRAAELWPAAQEYHSSHSGLLDDLRAGKSREAAKEDAKRIGRDSSHEMRAFVLQQGSAIEKAEADRIDDLPDRQ